jgi:hypothetical protein
VDIELPSNTGQPVRGNVTLEPGKPCSGFCSHRDTPIFDPFGLDSTFLQKTLLSRATVTISYLDGKTDTRYDVPSFWN